MPTDLSKDRGIREQTLSYFIENSLVLYFVLSKQGVIVETNDYSRRVIGRDLIGDNIKTILLNISETFEITELICNQPKEHLFNVNLFTGLPETYYFTFKEAGEFFLVFGRLDAEGLENLRKEIVDLNQELNRFTRDLYKKNAQLERANQELAVANTKILELTREDSLTNIGNRRYFDENIEKLASLSKRNSQPISAIMVDIDHFKRVNDSFGHDAGDKVLQGVAGLLKNATRAEDLVARYGGEEFILVLPLTDTQQAKSLRNASGSLWSKVIFLAISTTSPRVSGLVN